MKFRQVVEKLGLYHNFESELLAENERLRERLEDWKLLANDAIGELGSSRNFSQSIVTDWGPLKARRAALLIKEKNEPIN